MSLLLPNHVTLSCRGVMQETGAGRMKAQGVRSHHEQQMVCYLARCTADGNPDRLLPRAG